MDLKTKLPASMQAEPKYTEIGPLYVDAQGRIRLPDGSLLMERLAEIERRLDALEQARRGYDDISERMADLAR